MTDGVDFSLRGDAEAYLDEMAMQVREKAVADAHYAAVLEGRRPTAFDRADIEEGLRLRAIRSHQQVRTVVSVQIAGLLIILALGVLALFFVVLASGNQSNSLSLVVSAVTLAVVVFAGRGLFTNGRSAASKRASEASAKLVRPSTIQYLVMWDSLERKMRTDEAVIDDGPELRLGEVIQRFARRREIDPDVIRHLLQVRNSIAHGGARFSATEIAQSTRKLEELLSEPGVERQAG